MSTGDLSDFSMLELFRIETENQAKVLTDGLLLLERDHAAPGHTQSLMRAAHSLKGAARIVELNAAVRVAHAMEDCFVAAQKDPGLLGQNEIDLLLSGVDLLVKISQTPEAETARWENEQKAEIDRFVTAATGLIQGQTAPAIAPTVPPASPPKPPAAAAVSAEEMAAELVRASSSGRDTDRVLRVTADNLNRLLGLAGESLVESRYLNSFTSSLLRLKRQQGDLARLLDVCGDTMAEGAPNGEAAARLAEAQKKVATCREFLAGQLIELEMFDRRSINLSNRLYEEALACRMRPFVDGTHGFARMVRDVARSLGKEVRLEILGEATMVDRDMLEKLEAPLTHLLRNAVDHGIEAPEARRAAGKNSEGVLRLEARHSAGMLQVIVSDDGGGIDLEALRRGVVRRKLADDPTAARLSENELLEFLFLPGFTLKDAVTEISGRGVGLDVVREMVKQVRGTVRLSAAPGRGARFQLQMPLTLSVARTLLVEIGGEPYAFPLAYITRTQKLSKSKIELLEGRPHFHFDGDQIGLITAHQVLGRVAPAAPGDDLFVVVVQNENSLYGVVVDRFLGERAVVVHALDPRLGKIKDIAAGALMEDGSPALIVDVEDLIRSIDKLIAGGALSQIAEAAAPLAPRPALRILVVEDSLTVRELQRKLLGNAGYEVEVAVNGMDGWNAVRTGRFDLVISDVDMPRLDGIELVRLIKNDPATQSVPVIIVSYKDRIEDRQRGLDAGADYYMTKESFQPVALLEAVRDMIGEPVA